MINSTLIIGNGFDLNLGLKTSYKDFLNSEEFQVLLEKENVLADHLYKKSEIKLWIDLELELIDFSMNLYDNKEVTTNFRREFQTVVEQFTKYINNLNYDNLNTNSDAIKVIKDFLNNESTHNKKIINFNYSKSLEIVLKHIGLSYDNIEKLEIRAHGNAEEKKIILGVHDNSNVREDHTFLLKSSFSYYTKSQEVFNAIEYSQNLSIFGYSMGLTDEMYFKEVFSKIPLSNGAFSLNLYAYNTEAYEEIIKRIRALTNNRLTDFRSRSNFNTRILKIN